MKIYCNNFDKQNQLNANIEEEMKYIKRGRNLRLKVGGHRGEGANLCQNV